MSMDDFDLPPSRNSQLAEIVQSALDKTRGERDGLAIDLRAELERNAEQRQKQREEYNRALAELAAARAEVDALKIAVRNCTETLAAVEDERDALKDRRVKIPSGWMHTETKDYMISAIRAAGVEVV